MESKCFKNWKKHLIRYCKVNNINVEQASSVYEAMNSYYGSVNMNLYFSNNIYFIFILNNVKIFYIVGTSIINITIHAVGYYDTKYYRLQEFKTFYELLDKIFSKAY